jgi:hypothetical protein
MSPNENPSLLRLANLHPRIEYVECVDGVRKVFHVIFGDVRKEMEFCAKYKGARHIFDAIGEYPEAALEFLREFENFRTTDRRRFERAIAAAVETGGERTLFFLMSPARFKIQMRPETYRALLVKVVSLSSTWAQYFLEHLKAFRDYPGFEEAKEAACQRLGRSGGLLDGILSRLNSKK